MHGGTAHADVHAQRRAHKPNDPQNNQPNQTKTTPKVADPYWDDVSSFAYQGLQPHQDAVLREAEAHVRRLRTKLQGGGSRAASPAPARR